MLVIMEGSLYSVPVDCNTIDGAMAHVIHQTIVVKLVLFFPFLLRNAISWVIYQE